VTDLLTRENAPTEGGGGPMPTPGRRRPTPGTGGLLAFPAVPVIRRHLFRPFAVATAVGLLALTLGAGVAAAAGSTTTSTVSSTTTTFPDDAGATTPTIASTTPDSDEEVRVTTGLRYYPGGPEFTAYVPTSGDAPRPALIMVHGGGWQGGDQTELSPYAMDAATNNGWATFTVNYRLDSNDPSAWADELHDVQSAIRYIVGSQGGTYGIDPKQVTLLGDSAGANLIALISEYGTAEVVTGEPVGYDPTLAVPIKAVALWSPPTDLAALVSTAPQQPPPGCGTDPACDFTWTQPSIVEYIGCDPSACPERYQEASPVDNVSASTAPSYVANSTEELVPLNQVQQYVDELDGADVPNQFDVIDGDLHAAQLGPQVWPASVAFLARYVTTGGVAPTGAVTAGPGHGPWIVVGIAVGVLILAAGIVVAAVEHHRHQRAAGRHAAL
jgi:acetyl esterase/lipase